MKKEREAMIYGEKRREREREREYEAVLGGIEGEGRDTGIRSRGIRKMTMIGEKKEGERGGMKGGK